MTETTEANTEPVLANVKQRHLEKASGALDLAETVEAARNVRHNCCHYWIIEVAIDPLSKGACRLCGEEKFFRNQLQWAEIAPVRVMNGGPPVNDSMNIVEHMGEYAFLQAQSRYGRPMTLQSAGRGY